MTSECRSDAARAYGRAGKGRKSPAGRASSARNALRHGLSLPLAADPAASAELMALAGAIAPPAGASGPGEAGAELAELAQRIAEAQLDLVRVRRARHDLLAAALADPDSASPGTADEKKRLLARAAELARRRVPLPGLDRIIAMLSARPQGPDQLARSLGDLAPRLAAMDRYERHARARRTRAIEAHDHAKVYLMFTQFKDVP